jgi:hypothetical protein
VVQLPTAIAHALVDQSGVVSRRQVLEAGWAKHDIDRMVRRREWVRLLPGVYVDHSGRPTWLQRAWGGVLHYAPAAVAEGSALRLVAGPGWRMYDDQGPISIAVAAGRNVTSVPGYRIRWQSDFDTRTLQHLLPPRVRFEEACLDRASTLEHLQLVQLLAAACQSRRTTADRLLHALATRRRYPRRAWVAAVLRDMATGTCSVLEHAYLTEVERPHLLPSAQRQRPEGAGPTRRYRDATYVVLGLHLELDGRLFHDSPEQRDVDLERDLDGVLESFATVRLGWGQVVGRPCGTAAKLAVVFTARGWTGAARPCGPTCAVRSPSA